MIRRQPNRMYYRMRDVSKMTGVAQHTLRAWEEGVGLLRPRRDTGGNRVYREADVKIVLLLRDLLQTRGYTSDQFREALKAGRVWVDDLLERDLDEWLEDREVDAAIDLPGSPNKSGGGAKTEAVQQPGRGVTGDSAAKEEEVDQSSAEGDTASIDAAKTQWIKELDEIKQKLRDLLAKVESS